MTELKIGRDAKGATDYSINFSDTGVGFVLAADGTATVPVPSGASKANIQIQPGAVVKVSTTASPPANAAMTSTPTAYDYDLNPAVRNNLTNVSNLYFRAVDSAEIKVSFYAG